MELSFFTALVDKICERLGVTRGKVKIGKFKNQETNVEIKVELFEKKLRSFFIRSQCVAATATSSRLQMKMSMI